MRMLRNLVGDLLGYARCAITGDSIFGGYENIWYTESRGLIVSDRAMRLPPCKLAESVYRFVIQDGRSSPEETSVGRIMDLNGPKRADSPFAVGFQSVETGSSTRELCAFDPSEG